MIVQGPKGSTIRMCVCVCMFPVCVSEREKGEREKEREREREKGSEGEGGRAREVEKRVFYPLFLSHQILLVPLLPNSSIKHESSKEPR